MNRPGIPVRLVYLSHLHATTPGWPQQRLKLAIGKFLRLRRRACNCCSRDSAPRAYSSRCGLPVGTAELKYSQGRDVQPFLTNAGLGQSVTEPSRSEGHRAPAVRLRSFGHQGCWANGPSVACRTSALRQGGQLPDAPRPVAGWWRS